MESQTKFSVEGVDDSQKNLTARLATTARTKPTETTGEDSRRGVKKVGFIINSNSSIRIPARRTMQDMMDVNLEDPSEQDLLQIKKRNFRRFKGVNKEGYTDQKLNMENERIVAGYKHKVEQYHKLIDSRVPKVGLEDEQDMLKFFCENFLIDKIPDDYEAYMDKVKQKMAIMIEEKKKNYSDHMSMKGAMAKLSVNIRNFVAQKRKENKYLMGLRQDEEAGDELDKIEYFKKHKRNKEVIAEKFYIYKKIKDWSSGKGLQLTEQLKKDLEGISDKIFKYDKYFHQVKVLNDEIKNLREGLNDCRVHAAADDMKIKAELNFADEVLLQYQDDSKAIIDEVDALIEQLNRKFLF